MEPQTSPGAPASPPVSWAKTVEKRRRSQAEGACLSAFGQSPRLPSWPRSARQNRRCASTQTVRCNPLFGLHRSCPARIRRWECNRGTREAHVKNLRPSACIWLNSLQQSTSARSRTTRINREWTPMHANRGVNTLMAFNSRLFEFIRGYRYNNQATRAFAEQAQQSRRSISRDEK